MRRKAAERKNIVRERKNFRTGQKNRTVVPENVQLSAGGAY